MQHKQEVQVFLVSLLTLLLALSLYISIREQQMVNTILMIVALVLDLVILIREVVQLPHGQDEDH